MKTLTHDQRKAAEAAFRGLPFDPKWSDAARTVYDGILKSTQGRGIIPDLPPDEITAFEGPQAVAGGDPVPPATAPATSGETSQTVADFSGMSREDAVKAGLLIDVTEDARQLGLNLAVGFTKPVWEMGVTVGEAIPEEQWQSRVRDVLLALRLHLERGTITSPLTEFPALLSFPPEPAPQLCSLFVLAHKDASAPYCLTVLLPKEVSTIRTTLN